MSKEFFGYISIVLTFLSYVPYIISIYKGKTKPHFFSWLMWTMPSAIVLAAQLVSHAGAGSWAVGFSVVFNFIIMIYAWKYKEHITRSDWFFLFGGVAAILLWIITDTPLYAVILSTLIDVLGYGPTIRKSWVKPHEENTTSYLLTSMKHIASLYAMDSLNLTNTLFPIAMVIANGATGIFLLLRRWWIKR